MKKNNFIDFHHIPKLSIGFKRKKEQESTATCRLQEGRRKCNKKNENSRTRKKEKKKAIKANV